MTSRTVAVLGAALLTTGLAVGTSPAEAASRPISTTVRTLPHVGQGDEVGNGDGGRGTVKKNTAVAKACNAGESIVAPQWYSIGERTTGSLRVVARGVWYPPGPVSEPTGTAIVDRWSGKVLTCSTENFSRWKKPVDVVAYLRAPFGGGGSGFDPLDLNVLIDRATNSAPANDRFQDAQPIPSLPFTTRVDTSLATADGPWLTNYDRCLLSSIDPQESNSVWYRYTPTTTGPAPETRAVDATGWSGVNLGGRLRTGIVELLPDGSTRLVENADDWDCDTPVTLVAGRTYLVGAAYSWDAYRDSVLATGGQVTVSVTPATR